MQTFINFYSKDFQPYYILRYNINLLNTNVVTISFNTKRLNGQKFKTGKEDNPFNKAPYTEC